MNDILKSIGMDGTLQQILSVKYEDLPNDLKEVFKWKGMSAYFRWLSREDSLTERVYGPSDPYSMVTYPIAGKGVESPCKAPLGAQTSKYHRETVEEHILYVFNRSFGCGKYGQKFQLAALLHDCGKKYTALTNRWGSLCFYKHDRASAFIANLFMQQMPLTEADRRWVTTLVYHHMAPKEWASMDEKASAKSREKLLRALGTEMFEAVCEFTKCDKAYWYDDDNDLDYSVVKSFDADSRHTAMQMFGGFTELSDAARAVHETLRVHGWELVKEGSRDSYRFYEGTRKNGYKTRLEISLDPESFCIGECYGASCVNVFPNYDPPYFMDDLQNMEEAVRQAEKELVDTGIPFRKNYGFHVRQIEWMMEQNQINRDFYSLDALENKYK